MPKSKRGVKPAPVNADMSLVGDSLSAVFVEREK